ncbi:MAG TPA: MMPL family transporter [Dehalococcoidia bacterium]|nr:MMPL family transporter [Dehalococcoidia bacterium]
MRSIARFCYKRRRYVVAGWVLLLVGVLGVSSAFAGKFNTEFKLPGSESQRALDLLETSGVNDRTGIQGQVVFRADQGVRDPAVKQNIEGLLANIEANVSQVETVSPYEPGKDYQISADGEIAYAELNFSDRNYEKYVDDADVIKGLRDQVHVDGLQIELGGDIFAENPSFSSEYVGIIAAVIILLIAFGSVIAMGLPIITALFGIGIGASAIGLLTRFIGIPNFATQLAAMIGIGVGIDYALLIVSRYRDSLGEGRSPEQAVTLSLDTSGRAVLFAGTTVVISLLGMFLMNLAAIRAVSIGAILAVLVTMSAALTLLPAILGFAGKNIDKFGLPHRREKPGEIHHTIWWRWSRVIQAHPWPALLASAAVLVILAVPVLSLRLGFGDAGNRPDSDTSRRAYDLLSEGFGPGFNSPILIVAQGADRPPEASDLDTLAAQLRGTTGVDSVSDPAVLGNSDLALINVFPTTSPQDEKTTDLVHRLRDQVIPPVRSSTGMTILTTGGPAGVVDFAGYVSDHLPVFIAVVLALSFLLLMVVFHSVVVPLKAVLMNLLSIGASFGAMVAVFQWGWFGFIIGQGKEGPIEAWVPMMLFAILFGLSMDYEVFLLTRVREEYDKTGNNGRAVADGLAATGRVITAAAAIMVCVFGAFVLNGNRDIKLFGFGLAAAVLIDATIVRMVLVPSAMELMGRANWWAPRWLVRYLPTIRVEGDRDRGWVGSGSEAG